MGKVIGIDLGTTNSCVAVYEGEPKVIENSEGYRTTPSVVAFTKDERLVGASARRQAVTNAKNTVHAAKRLIGRRYDEPQIKEDIEVMPYDIVKADNGDAWVKVDDKKISPQEISSIILQKMKQTAEDYLGESINDAVITVPAYFNDSQRNATKDAGKIAGLNVLRVINEPTAAALAYGVDGNKDQTIAIYDFGGGTMDISVLEIDSTGVIEVKSTSGDSHLGGEDLDNALINYVLDQFKSDTGVDLSKDSTAMQRVKEASEKAKIELSSSTQTDLNIPFITATSNGPLHLTLSVTRAKFESLVDSIIRKTLKPCEIALKDANLSKSEINEIILVGGSTRVPAVQKAVTDFFGKEPNRSVNPDEAVATGAAIQGNILSGDSNSAELLLLDVTPLTLGIQTLGDVMAPIIEKNTTIPAKKSQVFTTASDGQTSVDIKVAQGERPMFKDNKVLGTFQLSGIAPSPRGIPQIEVTFDIDANGIVNVTATDKGTGTKQNITIQANGGLSDSEVDEMIRTAEDNREKDNEKKEIIDAKNEAEGILHSVKRSLDEHSDKIGDDLKSSIQESVTDLESTISDENVDISVLKEKTSSLKESMMKIGEAIYSQEQPTQENVSEEEKIPEDVVDTAYEEVNENADKNNK